MATIKQKSDRVSRAGRTRGATSDGAGEALSVGDGEKGKGGGEKIRREFKRDDVRNARAIAAAAASRFSHPRQDSIRLRGSRTKRAIIRIPSKYGILITLATCKARKGPEIAVGHSAPFSAQGLEGIPKQRERIRAA